MSGPPARLALASSLLLLLGCQGGDAGSEPSPAPPAPAAPEAASDESSAEPAEPAPRVVTIGASGDVLIHIKVMEAATLHADQGGYRHVLGGLREVIGEHEVALVNLETPLSMRVDPATGEPPVLGAPAEVADGLAYAGVDAASVANNHSYDQQSAGLEDTLAALRAADVGAAGAATTSEAAPGPVWIERGDARIAFLAFTERVNRGPVPDGEVYVRASRWDDERSPLAIAAVRERADLVVVSIHWSHDFRREPMDRQRRRGRAMIDAGADLVMGHGPHVLQTVERLESARGDAVIAYSLGNLVSNQALRYFVGRSVPNAEQMHPAVVMPELRDGAWLRARFELEGGRVRLDGLEAVPLWTVNNYLPFTRAEGERLDIRVAPLASMDEATRAERRPAITAALGDEVTIVDP